MDGLDWQHRIDEISKEHRAHHRKADARECAAMVAALDILSCEFLSVDYTLKALENGRIALRGQLNARGSQACVVSLEPVPFELKEDFDVSFEPERQAVKHDPDAELEVSSVQDVESYSGSFIDVGRVIFDHFSASLDPYPRAPGVKFERDAVIQSDIAVTHPFAALEKLKPKT